MTSREVIDADVFEEDVILEKTPCDSVPKKFFKLLYRPLLLFRPENLNFFEMGTTGQSLKAALQTRVSTSSAKDLYSASRIQGEGAMCPAGGGELSSDVYGRPVTANTLRLESAECSHYTGITARRYMGFEDNNRPYIPIANAGLRAGDGMGVGRDMYPMDVYCAGTSNPFVRQYHTANNAPPMSVTGAAPCTAAPPPAHAPACMSGMRTHVYSHDATRRPVRT